ADITAKALTVTGITASNKIYDGGTNATLVTGSATLVGVISPDVVTLNTNSASGAFTNKTIGTGKLVNVSGLTLNGADAGNYTLTHPTITAEITARTLSLVATGVTRVYNGTTNASVSFTDDRVAGDVFTISYSASFADKTIGTAKPISVTGISLSGTDSGNY